MVKILDLNGVSPVLGLGNNVALESDTDGLAINLKNGQRSRVRIAPAVEGDQAVAKSQLDSLQTAFQNQLSEMELQAGSGISGSALEDGLIQLALGANGGLTIGTDGLALQLSQTITGNGHANRAISEQAALQLINNNRLRVSQNSSSFVSINEDNELVVDQLLISNVIVDDTSADLAASLATPAVANSQKGDFLYVVATDQKLIHTGGSTGTAADWLVINSPTITDTQIRQLISIAANSQNLLTYNPSTGQFGMRLNSASFEGSVADGLSLKADGVKESHINFGTGADAVSAESVPVESHNWLAVTAPTDIQDGLEKLDEVVASKASAASVSALETHVVNTQADIILLERDKANQADMDQLGLRVENLTLTVADKAAQTSVNGLQTSVTSLQTNVTAVQTSITSVQSALLTCGKKMMVEFVGAGSFSLGILPANARATAYHVTMETGSATGSLSIGTAENATAFTSVGVFDVTSQDDTMYHPKTSGKSASPREMLVVVSGVSAAAAGVVIVEYIEALV